MRFFRKPRRSFSGIKTEKQALEALEQGTPLYEIPDALRRLESVSLAAVKRDGENLLYVETQTAEICVAAVQSAGEDVLKYVDPELRTGALLKACGIDAEDIGFTVGGEDGKFEYQYDEYWSSDNDETSSYYLCGKGDPEWLTAAQNQLRRKRVQP